MLLLRLREPFLRAGNQVASPRGIKLNANPSLSNATGLICRITHFQTCSVVYLVPGSFFYLISCFRNRPTITLHYWILSVGDKWRARSPWLRLCSGKVPGGSLLRGIRTYFVRLRALDPTRDRTSDRPLGVPYTQAGNAVSSYLRCLAHLTRFYRSLWAGLARCRLEERSPFPGRDRFDQLYILGPITTGCGACLLGGTTSGSWSLYLTSI